MSAGTPDQWHQQDGQILATPRGGGDRDTHLQRRWDRRCPEGWEGYPVRAAWREAEPHHEHQGNAFRLHEPSGMLLVSQWGFLSTCWPLHRAGTDADGEEVDL